MSNPRPAILQQPKDNPLYKTSKALAKATPEAIEFLVGVMRDEKADPKQRQEAAKWLAERGIQVADMMARDQLARVIAEVKVQALSAPRQQIKDVVEEDMAPRVLFSPDRILSVEGKEDTEIKVEPVPLDLSKTTHI